MKIKDSQYLKFINFGLVETAFSVIKRKYGSNIRAKTFNTQKIELISKIIAYNVDKATIYTKLLFRGFHQSPETKKLINNLPH